LEDARALPPSTSAIDVTKVVRLTEALNRAEERLPGR
jgi:hypothetical protein